VSADKQHSEARVIIDWADAGITDPVIDFMGLVIWLGPTFVAQVIDNYDRATDADFLDRVVILTRAKALIRVGQVLTKERNYPMRIVLAQLRAAFGNSA
jgi:hypothetical protein